MSRPLEREVAFDGNHLGKIERGVVGRPRDHYVATLCAVLGATPAELGFFPSAIGNPDDVNRKAFLKAALGASAGAWVTQHFPDHDASDLAAACRRPDSALSAYGVSGLHRRPEPGC